MRLLEGEVPVGIRRRQQPVTLVGLGLRSGQAMSEFSEPLVDDGEQERVPACEVFVDNRCAIADAVGDQASVDLDDSVRVTDVASAVADRAGARVEPWDPADAMRAWG
ncbi:hypothetical protein OHA40_30090 [Nocardia sp. NBC_00508]|uniref:hypothetical protein n=1 Tax=Nocardia sp. NBC_00508 TaxID=2975992 RepID=UPI002E818BE3|nr:hypothetical protein [Nocardia sp. NBC_00508]WUD70211.1 hypothetical protein OHA40_30090 [Nocardia sp. NBC_00508]